MFYRGRICSLSGIALRNWYRLSTLGSKLHLVLKILLMTSPNLYLRVTLDSTPHSLGYLDPFGVYTNLSMLSSLHCLHITNQRLEMGPKVTVTSPWVGERSFAFQKTPPIFVCDSKDNDFVPHLPRRSNQKRVYFKIEITSSKYKSFW